MTIELEQLSRNNNKAAASDTFAWYLTYPKKFATADIINKKDTMVEKEDKGRYNDAK